MLFLRVLCIFLFVNVIVALPQHYTEDELEDIQSIFEESLKNDARPNAEEDKEDIYKWAEVVYNCRKSRGLITTKHDTKKASSADKTPDNYRNEKNSDGEKDVPTWDLSPSHFDTIFDSARFTRYLSWDENPSYKRRITWLYPDNGAYKCRPYLIPCLQL